MLVFALRKSAARLERDLRCVLPDSHLLGILDQFISEIRMRDVDQELRPLPGVLAFEVGDAVFRDDEVRSRTRRRDDAALGEHRLDERLSAAVLQCSGRRCAEEAFASLGSVGAKYEVELTAGAGYLLYALAPSLCTIMIF